MYSKKTFSRSILAAAITSSLLVGCNLKTGNVSLNEVLGTVSFKNGKTLEFDTGFGSGAFRYAGDPANVFYTVTDRGPNIKCSDAGKLLDDADFCGDDTKGKIFPTPDFTPTIYKMRIKYSHTTGHSYEILEKLPLKTASGQPVTGIVNPLTSTNTENGYGADGNKLPFNPNGLDVEAIVKLSDGSFWLAEEYGPSLVHVSAAGNVIERIVPATLEQDLAAADYPVRGLLPEIYKKRKLNRGAESIAVSPDEKFLYFSMQSPLANPDNGTYSKSRNVRIMKLALESGKVTELVSEHVYVMDTPQTFANLNNGEGDLKDGKVRKQSDVKISEMVALDTDELVVLERISKVTKLYRINLASSSNILGSKFDQLETTPNLEATYAPQSANITPVNKHLVFNSLTDTKKDELPKKVEGIAILDDTNVVLINDNDFGIAGEKTRAVILPIAQQLKSGTLPKPLKMEKEGTYASGQFDESAAEIVAYDKTNQRIFVVNAKEGSVDVLDASNPAQPTKISSLNVSAAAPDLGAANSVAYKNGHIAVAIENANKQAAGVVAVYDATSLALVAVYPAGALPDMVTYTPDGTKIVVANEGEPNDDYTVDPEGSITLINIAAGYENALVSTLDFKAFNVGGSRASELSSDVRVFGLNASVAQDLEPEYITVSKDSQTAWVSLQENNALAKVDLMTGRIDAIQPLGYKDWSQSGNALDTNDKDKTISFSSPKNVLGMYQPDAIASYQWSNQNFIVTANEGDSRDYDGFSEETRAGKLSLSEALSAQVESEHLERLKVTTTLGKNAAGEYATLYSYGARSFSIWNGNGELVFDSGSDFERIVAEQIPDYFNASNSKAKLDNRSDDKGPEPEGIALGTIDGNTYAFIGLERVGGIMIYNITNPHGPQFVSYVNNRNFEVDQDSTAAGDLGPEGITFVPAADNADGIARLIVGSEVSGTTTIYTLKNL